MTTGTLTTATGIKGRCGWTRPITYSLSKDTPETVEQVLVHNQAGRNIRCWK